MTNNTIPNVPRELLERVASQPARGKADYELRALLSAPSPAGVEGLDGLDERMRAAGMLSAAELIAGAPLDAFMKHAGVNDLETFGQWLEMRRGECLRMQGRYDLGERDKSDDMYEWTVAHSAVFGEAHVNFKDALAGNQAIIDGLRGEVEQCEADCKVLESVIKKGRDEYDQQAQQIGELEGLLLRVQVSLSLDDTEWGYSGAEKYKLLADIRAALSAGKEKQDEHS